MSTLSDLVGLDHFLVAREVRRLRGISSVELRRRHLVLLAKAEGERIRDITAAAYAEDFAARKAAQLPTEEPMCAST